MGPPETLLPMLKDGTLDFTYIDIYPNEWGAFWDFTPYSVKPILEEEMVLACSIEY